jgi:hypothetical protein
MSTENKCAVCKSGFSCSCQKKRAEDGTIVCGKCLKVYNEQLKNKNNSPTIQITIEE